MASRKSAARKTKVGKPTSAGTLMDRIIDAGLDEAAAVGWRGLAMDAVASRAALDLGEVLLKVPGKACLLRGFLDRIDARTLAPVKGIDPKDTPRDRLFEILMRRFDALNEKRDGAKAVITGVARDPASAAAGLCRLQRSFVAMLAAAGISTGGLTGLARLQGLKLVAAYTLRAWMTDDSADLAKTMAALDRALDRAEKLAGMMTLRRRTKDDAAAA